MGTWNNKPYDNDSAADWFAGLMDRTKLREDWLRSLKSYDLKDEPALARAAVWLFLQLGHVYVWPIADYDSDLELAISTTKSLSNNEELLDQSGMKKDIESELAELVSRRVPE